MGKLIAHMSMSLDGFIAGPNPAADNPLGTNGLKLHDWIFDNPNKENEVTKQFKDEMGAIVMGRTMYYESLPYWGGTGPLGDSIPCFVLTEKEGIPESAGKPFTFVTGGIESALAQAEKAAGQKNVLVNGGANTIQQYIKADLLNELVIHLVPIVLGGGTSLFGSLGVFIELEKVAARDDSAVTHLTYRFK